MSVLTFAACSTTERIPEGEQLYLGIKNIKYAAEKAEIVHLEASSDGKVTTTVTTDDKNTEEGVIASIAEAYDKVQRLIDGTTQTGINYHQLEAKKRSELTREERHLLAAHEQAEAEALATAKEEIDAALAYEPNGSLFGSSSLTSPWKFGLWTYNHYADSQTKFGRWMYRKFGEQPILISTVAPQTRAKIATNTLHNYGYFRGNVDYDVVESKNARAARVAYNVTTGPVFHLDSVEYRSFGPVADSLLAANASKRMLKSGDAFSVVNLSAEQSRIESLMRENGYYYWKPSYTAFQADTVAVPGYVQMRVLPKAGIPEEAQRPWIIGNTIITIRDQQNSPLDHELKGRRGGTTYLWSGDVMPAKTRIWRSAISHRRGRIFRQSDQESTISKLAALGILSSLDVNYTPRIHNSIDSLALSDTPPRSASRKGDACLSKNGGSWWGADTLDVYVNVTMGKPYDSSFEVNATLKSSQQLGPGVRYELAKRNAFHGGETVAWDITGSYEWQLGRRRNTESNGLLNSFELGTSLKFEIPRFVFPGLSQRRLRFPASTKFALAADWKNRSGFFQMLNFGAGVTYNWAKGSMKHEWQAIDLTYYKLSNTTAAFDEIVEANPAIYASMRNVFVPSMSYSLTYSSPTLSAGTVPSQRRPFWLQWTVKEAGNLTDGLHHVFYPKHESGTPRTLLGSRFAQFVKTTAEVHYSYPFSERVTLATRAFGGVIYNYGGNDAAPYAEQFYIGGANSIRAFTVRTAGPGGYRTTNSKYAYIDQTGDFKLEANAELRARLIGNLGGAVFLDAGNVWLLHKDPMRPGAELSARNLRRIALGTGVGIRYDLDFLILRFDVGIGLHAPYDTQRSGFYNFERFRDGVAYHFAIGYPF